MTKPSKTAQYLAEADRLREVVDVYRAQKPATPPPQSTKPERRRLPPSDRPTEIPGWPLNSSRPGQDIPSYGSRSEAIEAARKLRRFGTVFLDPVGPPELWKAESTQ
jgi:hypothetical protein